MTTQNAIVSICIQGTPSLNRPISQQELDKLYGTQFSLNSGKDVRMVTPKDLTPRTRAMHNQLKWLQKNKRKRKNSDSLSDNEIMDNLIQFTMNDDGTHGIESNKIRIKTSQLDKLLYSQAEKRKKRKRKHQKDQTFMTKATAEDELLQEVLTGSTDSMTEESINSVISYEFINEDDGFV